MEHLLRLHEAARHLAATVPDGLAYLEVARAIEQEFVHAMIICLADGMAIGVDRRPSELVIQRFERFVEEHADDRRLVCYKAYV